jgi:hypothetical protein
MRVLWGLGVAIVLASCGSSQPFTSAGSGSGSGSTAAMNGCPIDPCLAGAVCQTDHAGNKTCLEECANGQCASPLACAPLTDPAGTPTGPYVCKANDGHSYDGCGPAACNACATQGFSCSKAGANGFYYCGQGCKTAADCGGSAGICCLPTTACGFCLGLGCAAGVCGPC